MQEILFVHTQELFLMLIFEDDEADIATGQCLQPLNKSGPPKKL